MENNRKLNQLGVPIAVIPALSKGSHVQGQFADKNAGQIPPRSLLGAGARVILTKNQKALTAHGLNNGAMGKVVSIMYNPGERPPAFPRYVIVDFPNYKGPPWYEAKPTWIPITPEPGNCENFCCIRTGLPLMPGYVVTITKAQGCTIAEGQQVTHMRLKLQNKTNFEILCPGTTYTGISRVDKDSSWALVDKIDKTRLDVINGHSAIQKRRDEDLRLKELHNITVEKFNITKAEFLDLIREVDAFCDDSINDAICNRVNCNCIACSLQT